MEFDIDVQHGWYGHIEITDYSKEYGQYYDEGTQGIVLTDKYIYSQSRTLNVITKVDSDKITLLDVFLDEHDQDKEQLVFDVKKDGYYTVTHFVLPTKDWFNSQLTSANNLIPNYGTIYYVDGSKIYKRIVTSEQIDTKWVYEVGDEIEVTIRELLERNLEGTTLQKCVVDIFYTGFLQECYINYCRALFKDLMAHCRPNCQPKDASADTFARDFLWMTLNVIDYLVQYEQYLEAQRILEEINYCGGFCKNPNDEKAMCGCNANKPRPSCGCSQA